MEFIVNWRPVTLCRFQLTVCSEYGYMQTMDSSDENTVAAVIFFASVQMYVIFWQNFY